MSVVQHVLHCTNQSGEASPPGSELVLINPLLQLTLTNALTPIYNQHRLQIVTSIITGSLQLMSPHVDQLRVRLGSDLGLGNADVTGRLLPHVTLGLRSGCC